MTHRHSNRCVVLHHQVGRGFRRSQNDHFDWMFDTGSDLITFATTEIHHWQSDRVVDCVRLPNHRRVYLDFEGDIPNRGEQRDRGRVDRVLVGTFTACCETEWMTATEFAVHVHVSQSRTTESSLKGNTEIPAAMRLQFERRDPERWSLRYQPLLG